MEASLGIALLGWPAMLIALLLSIFGILRRNPMILLVPVILILPVSFYLAGTPTVSWTALFIPLLFAGMAMAIYFRRDELAWICFLPNAVFFCWLAVIVLGQ